MKFIKIFFGLILLLIAGVVFIAGYLGFVPGLSNLMGTNKPRDLGVSYSSADLVKAQEKLQQKIIEISGSSTIDLTRAENKTPVTTILTNEEYNAHIEAIHPVKDFQIKMSGDTFELSGKIDKARMPQFLRAWGLTSDVSEGEIIQAINQYLPGEPVFYLSGSGSTTNDDAKISISKAELGRLPIPNETAAQVLEAYTELLIAQAPAFSVKSATIENGELRFDGTTTPEIPKY